MALPSEAMVILPMGEEYSEKQSIIKHPYIKYSAGKGFCAVVEFIDFFRSHSCFCNDIAAFWEAIIESVFVADTDYIAKLVPIVVGIQAVRGFGPLILVKPAAAAG